MTRMLQRRALFLSVGLGVVACRGDVEQSTEAAQSTTAKSTSARPSAERGKKIHVQSGCSACHSLDGRALVGPSYEGIYGKERKLRSGETVVADEAYLRESMLQPNAKVVAGYASNMPSYQGRLDEGEIASLIALIESLK